MRFQARTRAQAETWQQGLRAKVTELLGGFPTSRSPLRPVTLETRAFPGYRREKIVFDSRPGVSVLAYLLLPRESAASGARPSICVPGHGRGVDDIVGIDEQGRDRTDKAGYQHDFAIQVAEAGMAAVAIEPMAFGCRRDPLNARQGLSHKGCEPAAGGALLARRDDDRLARVGRDAHTRLHRDPAGAGRRAASAAWGSPAAARPRCFRRRSSRASRAAMVSGYLNTFRDSVGSLAHCVDNYVPGILNWAEMHDVAGLIAPRPLFVESGEKDNIFPIAASIASFNEVREIYTVFQAADRAEQEVFPDEHSFWGKRGIPFMARHLSG